MFTGIISHTSPVRAQRREAAGLRLTFKRPPDWTDLQLGESVNTDGVCLTVAALREREYDCVLVPETLSRSTFGRQAPPLVNLERALRAGDRLGGHFVQGHVDEVGPVKALDQADGYRLRIGFNAANRALVVEKGSIAVNGVSLTIAALTDDTLTVALVPHTLEHTTLGSLQPGDPVNLEFDMLGKYALNRKEYHAAR